MITIATKSLFGLATGALRAMLRVRKIGIDAVVDMEFLTRFSGITDVCDRRQIACWLLYFFWRRTVPRRLNDAPSFIQSSSPYKSDVRSHGRSIDPLPSGAADV